jgi:hypothetical protein
VSENLHCLEIPLVLIINLIDNTAGTELGKPHTAKSAAKRFRKLSTLPNASTKATVLAAGGWGEQIGTLHKAGRKRRTADALWSVTDRPLSLPRKALASPPVSNAVKPLPDLSSSSDGSSTPRASTISVATVVSEGSPQILPFDMVTDSDNSFGPSGDGATNQACEYCYLSEIPYPLIVSIDESATQRLSKPGNAAKSTLKPSHNRKMSLKQASHAAQGNGKKKRGLQNANKRRRTGEGEHANNGEASGGSVGFTEIHAGVVVNQAGTITFVIWVQCLYVDWNYIFSPCLVYDIFHIFHVFHPCHRCGALARKWESFRHFFKTK